MQDRVRGAEIDSAEAALAEAEKKHGRESMELCPDIDNLAALYHVGGLYAKAELLYKRSLEIVSKCATPEDAAAGWVRLGTLYKSEGKFDDAESVYLRALAATPENTRLMADRLSVLSGLYVLKNELSQAEDVMRKALGAYDAALGENNCYSRLCHLGLAEICRRQGKTGDAEQHLLLSKEPAAATDANEAASEERSIIELGRMYFAQGRFDDVASLLANSLFSDEQKLWPDHPRVGQALHERGELFRAQGMIKDAEKCFKRALEIRERALGNAHPEVAYTALSLAAMYLNENRVADAEPYLRSALKTRVRAFGVEHPSVAACIETYVSLLKRTKRGAIAQKLEARARDIRTKLVWQAEKASQPANRV